MNVDETAAPATIRDTPSPLAPLIARDAALPGMALLAEHARGRLGYLRYKPGTSLVATVRTAQGPAMAYVTSTQAAPKLAKLAAHAPAGSVLLDDRRARLLIALPVADRDLPGLRRRLGPDGGVGARTFAYKPQRRWVGLPAGAGPDADVLRCYRREDLAPSRSRWPEPAASAGAAGTGAGPDFRIPAIVRTSTRHSLLRTERVPGRGLDDLLAHDAGADVLDLVRAAGRALAGWHRLPAPPQAAATGSDPQAAAALLACLLPDQSARIADMAARLASSDEHRAGRGAPASTDPVWCHGDFSTDQILVEPSGSLWLMDWDRSGAGTRATDLAGAEAAGLTPAAREALLEGYGSAADLPADLDRVRARTLFSRAADPFRRAEPDWPALVTARLDTVQELLP